MLHLLFRLGEQEVTLLVSLSRTQCAVPSGLPASSASAAPRRYADACSATPNAASGLSCRTLYIRSASTGHVAHARRGSRAETQFGLRHSARFSDGRGWPMRPFRPLRMHAGIMHRSDATDDATKRTATAHASRRTVRSSMAWHGMRQLRHTYLELECPQALLLAMRDARVRRQRDRALGIRHLRVLPCVMLRVYSHTFMVHVARPCAMGHGVPCRPSPSPWHSRSRTQPGP